MIISALSSFILANIYYHFDLKEKNDAKVMDTLKDSKQYFGREESHDLQHYFEHLGDMNYQVYTVDEHGQSSSYGEPFRKMNLSDDDINQVLNGKDYHGIKERPFNIFITGFFDNESRNTVGTTFSTKDGKIAVFVRPDIGHAFGEFRIFLIVLLILLIAISILLVIASTYTIVKPIKQLKYATTRLMNGDFNTPIEITRKDELGTLQQRFETMRLSLQQLDAMRQHFVQNVSHEIKTPLTHIHQQLDLMQNENDQKKKEEHIKNIYNITNRLSDLTRQLLLLSEIDNGEHLEFKDSINLKHLIQSIVRHENYQVEIKSLVIMYDLDHLRMRGNYRLIYQALQNIISNAIKYTEPYGIIEVNLKREENYIVCEITDDGKGMTQETRDHIFDRFYKQSEYKESNGLGLPISKSIIDLHHGTINVESEIGEGTTFTIKLPYNANDEHTIE